ncbi:uncharacterized protein LOC110267810 isoform X1 [Arachis ipaensis]|uniref:uncharacterized protein LOC110267810 isoform X1 n=1 Tax=Arachis ipaensis TaxID=130454 RepID=UPI000A2B282F|nr:uncharacterized protein LOC110267810 isoform X1 [Arachis ipaensis]
MLPPKLLAATSDRAFAAGERCCHRKPPLKPVYVGNCRRNPCLLGLGSGIYALKLRLLLNHRSFGECRSCRLIGSEGHCCFVSRVLLPRFLMPLLILSDNKQGCCRCCKIENKQKRN